ncbi:hypothetical protein LSCM4_07638 [Leishmania orientalis]|uniref:Uncharacterized protein n=1 Tax=Leishmania orientalis TaxID=2249476 RepID=A0A836KS41_9TRYP|nr:hypothetical protein LSCM4_07638 [Leishmania orientalis]
MPLPSLSRSAMDATCGGDSASARAAGGAHNAGSPRDMIHFKDALGMLWYAMLMAHESEQNQRRRSTWSGAKRTTEDGSSGKDALATAELQRRSSEDVGVSSSSDPKGDTRATLAAVSPSTSTIASAPTAAQRADREFDSWGQVDWTLLAAHVYALTGDLYSARALHRVVSEDIYRGAHSSDREAMCAAYAAQHAEVLDFYAKEAQEEEERAAAARLQTPLAISASTAGSSRLASAAGGLQATSSLAHSSSRAGAHAACLPVGANVQGTAPSSHDTGKVDARSAPPLSSTRSDTEASSLAPSPRGSASAMPQAPAVSPSARTPQGGAKGAMPGRTIADVRMAGAIASVGSSASPSARGSSPTPSLRDADVVGRHAAGDVGRAVTTGQGELPTLPPGAQQRSNLAVVDQSAAIPGESLSTGQAHKSDHVVISSTTPPSSLFEPDPLDAPWHALWCSLPSPQARAQLNVLRYATPLPLEDFSSLLEQFFLVDGADDFLSPVHAATIMEFAGVRSGPYNTIVRYPLSLAEVRRYISESHRHYARAAMMAHMNHTGGITKAEAASRPQPGTPPPDTASALATSFQVGTLHAVGSGSDLAASSAATSTKAEYRGLRRGGVPPAGAVGSSVRSLLDSTASNEKRVLTLAELERSIWHVAANCAVFNAPESRYPRTARHFAASCIAIMTRYCEKQLAAFYTA